MSAYKIGTRNEYLVLFKNAKIANFVVAMAAHQWTFYAPAIRPFPVFLLKKPQHLNTGKTELTL